MTDKQTSNKNKRIFLWKTSTIILVIYLLFTQVLKISLNPNLPFLQKFSYLNQTSESQTPNILSVNASDISNLVIPQEGIMLPIVWGDLGKKMINDGVIDEQKFRSLFEGGLTNTEEQMLTGYVDQPIVINSQNSRYILDLLWAFGLANKNDILDTGEMTDKQYGGVASFASTGGWVLSKSDGADHYSKHTYITLSSSQQALVDNVSKNIFRPCCGNSTHFPDCNHGMAMLGLLELMAYNNVSEKEMYDIALKVNSYWFPQTYIDLATYFMEQGQNWQNIDSKLVLGAKYSSAKGYQETRQKIKSQPALQQGGGGCGA